ncbi:MAG: lytic transglycosylase, partial [Deltaproteobacteria bacterium]|nr:lytic transglycosylase [Deltaproteobacteria bacterium]
VVEVIAVKQVPLKEVAAACGTYYKTIKELNPWIRGRALPPGAYRLKVPRGAGPGLLKSLKGLIANEGN